MIWREGPSARADTRVERARPTPAPALDVANRATLLVGRAAKTVWWRSFCRGGGPLCSAVGRLRTGCPGAARRHGDDMGLLRARLSAGLRCAWQLCERQEDMGDRGFTTHPAPAGKFLGFDGLIPALGLWPPTSRSHRRSFIYRCWGKSPPIGQRRVRPRYDEAPMAKACTRVGSGRHSGWYTLTWSSPSTSICMHMHAGATAPWLAFPRQLGRCASAQSRS